MGARSGRRPNVVKRPTRNLIIAVLIAYVWKGDMIHKDCELTDYTYVINGMEHPIYVCETKPDEKSIYRPIQTLEHIQSDNNE